MVAAVLLAVFLACSVAQDALQWDAALGSAVEALELLCYHHHCKNSHRMGIYLVEGLKTIATCWFDLLTWLNIRLHASFFTSRNQFAIFFVLLSNISKKKHK